MHKIKGQKGITLIALIITIIVMLILVGVSVTVALNGGLFSTAKQGTDQTQIEVEKEQLFSTVMGAIGEDGKVDFEKLDNNLPEGFTKVGERTYKSIITGKTYVVSENGSITMVEEPEEPEQPETPQEGLLKLKVEIGTVSPVTLLISYEIPELTVENITDEQTIRILAQAFNIPGEIESYEELYLKLAQGLSGNEELTYEQLLVATGKEEPTTQDVFLYLLEQAGFTGIDTPQQAAIITLQNGDATLEVELLINNEDKTELMTNEDKEYIQSIGYSITEYGEYEISIEVEGIKDEVAIQVNEQAIQSIVAKWDTNKVDIREEGISYVPIPKGFEVLKTAEKPQGYTIDEGLVITDEENEFVWVPVSNAAAYTEDDFGPLEGTMIINGESVKNDSYKIIQYYYGDALGTINNDTSFNATFTYEADKANIERSIRTYGGFYVGRYETTYDSLSNGVPQGIGVKQGKDVLGANNLLKPETETKPANNDKYYYRWWGLYKAQKDMYADSDYVGSLMISDNQWEAIMDHTDYRAGQRPTNSYKESNAPDKSGSAYSTNSNKYDEAKNIYDLAGNLYEWTIGAYDSVARVRRGGGYNRSNYTASYRDDHSPDNLNSNGRF